MAWSVRACSVVIAAGVLLAGVPGFVQAAGSADLRISFLAYDPSSHQLRLAIENWGESAAAATTLGLQSPSCPIFWRPK